ncbi:MAG: di-trans,poly-cis-decaprenylcistransferase, partial [Deltaproteobacteria bacterium RIFOXYD12_FULL_50_9]
SYSGRSEIVNTARALARQCQRGNLTIAEITEDLFSQSLSTGGLPDPDLLIRTGGESRLSNFLLWQLSYAEIYITETRWPDFRRAQLIQALIDFQKRQRRFGLTTEQLQGVGG